MVRSFRLDRRRFLFVASALLAAMVLPRVTSAAQAAGEDAAILPYIDEGTFFVLRLDVDRVEQASVDNFLKSMMSTRMDNPQIPENVKQQIQEAEKKQIEETKTWLTDMKAAGGNRLYVLIDKADQMDSSSDGPVIVIPLKEGADADKIKEVMSRDAGRQTTEVVGKAVVTASEGAVGRVKTLIEGGKPAARPDLPAAFAAAAKSAKDAPIRIAFVPGESTRAWIEESLPQLPDELGGGEAKVLSRGVKYAAAGVSQKPGVLAHITVKAENAEEAKSLFEVVNKGTATVKQMLQGTPQAEETDKKIKAMNIKLAGDTITLSADPVFAQSTMMAIMISRMGAGPGAIRPAPPDKTAPAKPDDGGL